MNPVFDLGSLWLTKGVEGITLISPSERECLRDVCPPDARVLEIGSWMGATAGWLCQERPDIYLLAIDNFAGGAFAGSAWASNARRFPNMRLWVGTAQQWKAECSMPPFDVVLVDGDHSYAGCYKDLQTSAEVVKPGGVVAIHDYGVECLPGIAQATGEVCDNWDRIILERTLLCLRVPE